MKEYKPREIDLVDLFITCLSHWRSLLIFIFVGIVLAGLYVFWGEGSSVSTSEGVELSHAEIQKIEDLTSLKEEYEELLKEYEAKKTDLELIDRAETLSNLGTAFNIIRNQEAALTADQKSVYFGEAEEQEEVQTGPSPINALMVVCIAVFFHLVFWGGVYVFDNKIKRTDCLSEIACIPEFTRMIDWDKVNSAKGLDKVINKIRYAGMRKTALRDVVEINVSAAIEKVRNNNYTSLAVVGVSLDEERKIFTDQIAKDYSELLVKSIDSITHSVNGADDIMGIDAAVLVVKVGITRYNDLAEELHSLRDRGVNVIGVAVFE